MKIRKIATVALTALIFSHSASAGVTQLSGSRSAVIDVECLNDSITLSWQWDMVIATKTTYDNSGAEKTWMFTRNVRQYGSAVDSHGNTWRFRGHFSATEHVKDGDWWDNGTFHLLSKDIMIADRDGLGVNLNFISQWRIRRVDGIWVTDIRESSAKCLPK